MARDHGGRYLQYREHRWAGLGLELARWQGGPATEGVCHEAEHLLLITLGGTTERTETRIDDGHRYSGADFPGAVSFIPAGRRREARHGTGVLDYVTIRLPAPRTASSTRASPTTRTRWSAAPAAPLLQPRPSAPTAAGQPHGPPPPCGGRAHRGPPGRRPAPRAARGAGRMDRHHFGRAFKQATGRPPHRYVTEQRVTRATELLAGSDLPIADIAHQVGMSSQSHLTTVFRRFVGDTPHAYRRARRAR
ncbi:MAG: helix-turn-helix transcriptional regulator [Pseudonocardiaceae bacterium]|nr:helix-turn-helix transcriptional regulator [Pseudonocardiaceae bacterium]